MSLPVTMAAPFRHTRKDQLKKNEIVYYLAFERGWMNIEQANLLLARAKEEGLISYEGDMINQSVLSFAGLNHVTKTLIIWT